MRALLFPALLATGPVWAGPYDGTYRPDAPWAESWDCKTVGMDGGAMAIRDDTFFSVETVCKLQNPVAVRDMNATLFDAACSGEGETWSQRMLIATSADGVSIVFGDGTASPLKRCK